MRARSKAELDGGGGGDGGDESGGNLKEASRGAYRQVYPQGDVNADLLALAARALTVGGRLVYLLPSTYGLGAGVKSCDGEAAAPSGRMLPEHPCMQLISCCEQPLTGSYARLLVTMEKIAEFFPSQAGAHGAYTAAGEATRRLAQAAHASVTTARKGER